MAPKLLITGTYAHYSLVSSKIIQLFDIAGTYTNLSDMSDGGTNEDVFLYKNKYNGKTGYMSEAAFYSEVLLPYLKHCTKPQETTVDSSPDTEDFSFDEAPPVPAEEPLFTTGYMGNDGTIQQTKTTYNPFKVKEHFSKVYGSPAKAKPTSPHPPGWDELPSLDIDSGW